MKLGCMSAGSGTYFDPPHSAAYQAGRGIASLHIFKSGFMDDHQFRQLLQRFGLSWKGYRKVRKGVKKRIRRHMRELGCQTVEAYLDELDKCEEVSQQCERLMTVSISRFFRDRRLWQVLQEEALPSLIEKEKEKINVWCAGCACGEEVYSFKIVWETLKATWRRFPELEIMATDINPIYLDRAQGGIYPSSSLREVQKEVRLKYFQMQGGGTLYAILSPSWLAISFGFPEKQSLDLLSGWAERPCFQEGDNRSVSRRVFDYRVTRKAALRDC